MDRLQCCLKAPMNEIKLQGVKGMDLLEVELVTGHHQILANQINFDPDVREMR